MSSPVVLPLPSSTFQANAHCFRPLQENHHWLLGQMITLLSTPWMPYLYREWSRDCPDAPFLRILKIGQSETLVPNTITAYREVLQTKNDCFVKSQESRNGAAMVIGDGLPWAHGDDHRARRAVLNKLFAPQRMKACVPKIKAKAEQLCRALAAKQSVPGDAVTGMCDQPTNPAIELTVGAVCSGTDRAS